MPAIVFPEGHDPLDQPGVNPPGRMPTGINPPDPWNYPTTGTLLYDPTMITAGIATLIVFALVSVAWLGRRRIKAVLIAALVIIVRGFRFASIKIRAFRAEVEKQAGGSA